MTNVTNGYTVEPGMRYGSAFVAACAAIGRAAAHGVPVTITTPKGNTVQVHPDTGKDKADLQAIESALDRADKGETT